MKEKGCGKVKGRETQSITLLYYNAVIGISETLYKEAKPYILQIPWRLLRYISIGRFI